MVTYRAEVEPTSYGTDHWHTPRDGDRFRLYSTHQGHETSFTIYFVGPQGQARRVHGGPLVPGPHADLVAQATVIHAARYGDLGRTGEIRVEPGDTLEVRGYRFVIRDDRRLADPGLYLQEEK